MGDSTETLRRLRWRCRRGLLELDAWLEAFARTRLRTLDDQQLSRLEQLLAEPDLDILDWLEGRQTVPTDLADMVRMIRASV